MSYYHLHTLPEILLSVNFVHVTPFPWPVRKGYHYWVSSFLEVVCSMHSRRRVATPDMAASKAEAQGNPVASSLSFTFFTALCLWHYIMTCTCYMFTGLQFFSPLNISRTPKSCKEYPLIRFELFLRSRFLATRCNIDILNGSNRDRPSSRHIVYCLARKSSSQFPDWLGIQPISLCTH